MKYYQIKNELQNKSYCQLLEMAQSIGHSFSMVWRNNFKFQNTATKIEVDLSPDLITERLTNEWPGTKIFGPAEHIIRYYKISQNSVAILKRLNSINSWTAPAYPEDLAFYLEDNTPWFGSVSHEGLCYFFGEKFDMSLAKEKINELQILK